MRLDKRFARVALFAAVALAALYFVIAAKSLPAPAQGGGQARPAVQAAKAAGNGLRTATFDTLHGTVSVNLPDDMRAGDTISGTVSVEPKGQTEEERAKSMDALRAFLVEISPQGTQRDVRDTATAAAHVVRMAHYSATNLLFTMTLPPLDINKDRPLNVLRVELKGEGSTPGTFTIPVEKGWTLYPIEPPAPTQRQPGDPGSGGSQPSRAEGPQPPGAGRFQLPTLGQQGRAVEIPGPFDGDASNTTLHFTPPGGSLQDFEKGTENVSGGFGLARPLAESPRKLVFESPPDLTGPAEIVLKEGSAEARGPYRSVGVRLSAPKTNLLRGERTTLTVAVSGLAGVKENVPLQLDARGVINMDGGNFQNLWIKPQEVKPDGRYTTNRAITGQQAGGFTVTATVVVRRFDMCLQDDRNPSLGFMWNSFTGDYVFLPPIDPVPPTGGVFVGGSRRLGGTTHNGGGTTQPAGGASGAQPTIPPIILPGGTAGPGKLTMRGCLITLMHTKPERRIFANLDVCTRTGGGEVQTDSPKEKFNITDSNTADSVCPGAAQQGQTIVLYGGQTAK